MFSDRVDQGRLLAACEIAQCLLVVVILVWLPPLGVLLVLLFLKATAATIADPAARSAVPALVADTDLTAANAMLGGLRQIAAVVGPLLGGVLVATVEVRGALGVDAVSFVVGAILLLRLPRVTPCTARRSREDGCAARVMGGRAIRHVASRSRERWRSRSSSWV